MSKIYDYITGQLRYKLYKINPKLIRTHIREQVEARYSACSPKCTNESRCCGCQVPNVFFASKACKDGNYPKLMNSFNWKLYKQRYNGRMEIFYDGLYELPENTNIYYIMNLPLQTLYDMREYLRLDKVSFNLDDAIKEDEPVYGEIN